MEKRIFEEGRKVHAPYGRKWYPGKVSTMRVVGNEGEYGQQVVYDILFDDGDNANGVSCDLVFDSDDYNLGVEYLTSQNNIKNVLDGNSKDEWAKDVGWYVATINGQLLAYPLLSEAKRAVEDAQTGGDLLSGALEASYGDDRINMMGDSSSDALEVSDEGNISFELLICLSVVLLFLHTLTFIVLLHTC